jgi:hypothetical protein
MTSAAAQLESPSTSNAPHPFKVAGDKSERWPNWNKKLEKPEKQI